MFSRPRVCRPKIGRRGTREPSGLRTWTRSPRADPSPLAGGSRTSGRTITRVLRHLGFVLIDSPLPQHVKFPPQTAFTDHRLLRLVESPPPWPTTHGAKLRRGNARTGNTYIGMFYAHAGASSPY